MSAELANRGSAWRTASAISATSSLTRETRSPLPARSMRSSGSVERALDEALAQVGERGLAEAGDERLADGGQPALDDRGEQQQEGRAGEVGVLALLGDEVDDVAEQGGDGEARRGRHEQGGAGREHEAARAGERERGAARLRRGRDRQRLVGAAHSSTTAR